MQSLGHFSGSFRLWVDALCIDQSNNEERTDQVAEMGRFYSTAWSMVAFLGPEAHDSSKAIDLVEDLASYYGRQGACERLKDELMRSQGCHEPGSWLALNHLAPVLGATLDHPRAVSWATRTVLFVGSKTIDWQRFCHGIEVVHRHLWVAKNTCVARDRKVIDPPNTRIWESSGPLHHIFKDLWALSQTDKLKDKPVAFSSFLEVGNFSNSFDPRDKVYGLLGLMPPMLATRIVPDYAVDAATTFTNVAMLYFIFYNNLELFRDANVWGTSGAPTWAPDWAWHGRIRDSRPGADGEAYKLYGADLGLKFEGIRFLRSQIHCKAVLFDQVDGMGTHPPSTSDAVIQSKNWCSAYGDTEATGKHWCVLYTQIAALLPKTQQPFYIFQPPKMPPGLPSKSWNGVSLSKIMIITVAGRTGFPATHRLLWEDVR
jgi:hypothetical protein